MEPAGMELRHYFQVLRNRASVVLVIAALAVGGVVFQLGMQPARYAAEVSVLVTPQTIGSPGLLADAAGAGLANDFRATVLADIIYLMKTRVVYQRVGERLGMSAGAIAKQVIVKPVKETDILTVTARDSDPERAALLANTFTQEFTNYYSEVNRADATSARKFVEDQLSRTKERLAQAEGQLQLFQTRTGTVLNDQAARMVGRSLDLQAEYDKAALDQQAARAKVDAVQTRLRSQNDQLGQLFVATNPVFDKYRDSLTTAEIELAGLRQTYTDQHPKVQALLGKVAQIKQQMTQEAAKAANGQSLGVSPVREQLIRDLVTGNVEAAGASARMTGMNQIMAKLQSGLNNLPANILQLARLQRDVKVQEETYLRLSTLYEESLIKERKAGTAGQAAVLIVDPATVPSVPDSKHLPLMATFAALMGLIVGAAIALLVDGLDDSVRSTNEAEGAYGVPVLAAIPTMDPQSHRYLSGAPAISTVSLPVVVAVLLGVGSAALSLFLVHQGSGSDHTALVGRLLEVFQTAR